ncbi:SAM-dependent methyltransferase [Streptomonospora sp. S1-112]|uniref:SAM-dependent methyltransferase n=1 Tax=Streptomonospora mangrovi TaxID=2883123 RepID=A0A9X3SIM7_9ACTN|nr:SAM-dependent methyltransferase [Streptomonospora mangrovi]MDA0566459.1 SAM-dependent methyltransferase [Streptomonospora mangrovi]
MNQSPEWMRVRAPSSPPPEIDSSVAHPARVWDYWLGGQDNFAADRETGDRILAAFPDMVANARADREFLGRAVRYLAGQAGMRQFLDIGTGIPAAGNTHEIVQEVAPGSRVVYVDNDPVVLAHARALLVGDGSVRTDYVDADLRDPEGVLAAAAATLDLDRPVAVLLLGILEFVPDDGQAAAIVQRLLAAVPGGSHIVIAHSTNEVHTAAMEEAARLWNAGGSTPLRLRDAAGLERLLAGLEVVDPGVVSCALWRPDPAEDEPSPVAQFGAVARKP